MTTAVPDRARAAANPEAALVFRRLHEDGLLILANAWDAGSARLIESLGARAIATSSAAVAWSHGYADGDVLPLQLLLATLDDIVRVVRVPVSADIEGGYAETANAMGGVISQVIDAGAVGINIEDGVGDPDRLCARIEQARQTASARGVELFVNARTDVYLRGLVPPDRRVEETLLRAERYRKAGADGIFVPGVSEETEIRTIASTVRLPLNVLAWPGLPAASRLRALGVRRLSAGSGIAQAIYGRMAKLARGFFEEGISDRLGEEVIAYAEMNPLFATP